MAVLYSWIYQGSPWDLFYGKVGAWLEPDICDIDIHVARWDVYLTGRQHAEYVMGIYQLYAALCWGFRKVNVTKSLQCSKPLMEKENKQTQSCGWAYLCGYSVKYLLRLVIYGTIFAVGNWISIHLINRLFISISVVESRVWHSWYRGGKCYQMLINCYACLEMCSSFMPLINTLKYAIALETKRRESWFCYA